MVSILRKLRDRLLGGSQEPLAAASKLIVGLGNPGSRYAGSRHNIGFRVVECLAERNAGVWQSEPNLQAMACVVELGDESLALLAPQTFMNRSGDCVVAALDRWPNLDPATDLIVVYDDLDLATGRIRLRPSGGGGGHNGIGHILECLDSHAIPRLRFGIGHPGDSQAVIDWVLGAFTLEEQRALPSAIEWAAEGLEAAVREGVASAMGRYNAVRVQSNQIS
jgi:PTH1 family peptidyl-tRNA hydrolase